MIGNEDEIGRIFAEMLESGLVATSSRWIERAAQQKNPRLTLDMACSNEMVYDVADKLLFAIHHAN